MKQFILLIFILSLALNINAQCDNTLPVNEDFSNTFAVNSCWTYIDADGDGLGWSITSMDGSGNKGLKSKSFAGTALTPDNWIISNAIDLPSSSSIELSWKVRATFWQYDAENYYVYVANGNAISDFTSSSVVFTENLEGSDASGVFANRSLDVSSLSGQTVYIAFRHYGVTDQLEIDVDDFQIASSGALSTEDLSEFNFKHYYNTTTDELVLKSNTPFSDIKLYNIIGQQVIEKKLSRTEEAINLSNISIGVYIAKIQIDNTIGTIKFVIR